MKPAVICVLPSELEAEAVISLLKEADFQNTDIWVLMPDSTDIHHVEYKKHNRIPGANYMGGDTAGLIMAILCGAAIGATAGGITPSMIGLGMSEYEAQEYEGKLHDGNVFLSVHFEKNDQAKRAEEIFKSAGACNIKTYL